MFSVPGWNVSANRLVQEQPKSTKHKHPQNANLEPIGIPRKRKREHAQNLGQVENSTESQRSEAGSYRPWSSKQQKHNEANPIILGENALPTAVTSKRKKKQEGKHSGLGRTTKEDANTFATKRRESDNQTSKPSRNSWDANSKSAVRNGTAKSLTTISTPPSAGNVNLTPLQAKMRNKLTSARFRHLNETLYTTSSVDALALFSASPDLFAEYHAGFSQQVKDSWPQNPVDTYIRQIRVRGALSQPQNDKIPLPRRKPGNCTIVDLGCGDAPLARGCQEVVRKSQLRFYNYDLHAPNTFVTKADISNLPLRDGEADIAVFCLSLMGTNWITFVEEAWRILRGDGKGEVWVAEVKSRFGRVTKGRVVENSVGKQRKRQKSKPRMDSDENENADQAFAEDIRTPEQADDETDISGFIKVFQRRGFLLREGSVDKSNKMFVSMTFVKAGVPIAGKYKGMKWNGKEYQRQQERPQKSRFPGAQRGAMEDELSIEEEAKVLKPCVYKIR